MRYELYVYIKFMMFFVYCVVTNVVKVIPLKQLYKFQLNPRNPNVFLIKSENLNLSFTNKTV